MDTLDFENKMIDHKKAIDLIIDKINIDVIEFTNENKNTSMYDLRGTDNFCDELIQSAGWIKDKINDTLNTEKPKKSLVRKLRKALGYTFP